MPDRTGKKPRDVLVIDDDETIRLLTQSHLEDNGFVVRTAEDGESGIESFRQSPPGIVLLDVRMPGINGFEVCAHLRALPAGRHTPILIMTGSEDSDSVANAFGAGATDFTNKPLNLDLLVHRMNFILRAKDTADQLRHREESLIHAQRIARLGTWTYDLPGSGFKCSNVLADLLGLDEQYLHQTEFLNSVHRDDRARIEHSLWQIIENKAGRRFEFRWVTYEQRELYVSFDAWVEKDEDGQLLRLSGTMQDITERRQAETRIRTLAYYDGVTGLPNRALLQEHLNQAVGIAIRHKQPMAVLLIDLDHFKSVNDRWGHQIGDQVLEEVGTRLRSCLRDTDIVASAAHAEPVRTSTKKVVARIGGDEFVILLSKLRQVEDAAIVARRVNEALAVPFRVDETDVHIGSSIGISVCPDDSEDAQTLLKQADGAMYETKNRGRNGFHFYTNEIQERALKRIDIEARLRRAIEQDEFVLHYQPKISIANGEICGLEALIRWQDPALGLISPAEFIPVAEDTGLIVPLGQWVTNTACHQVQALHKQIGKEVAVSVNLSARQLKHSHLIEELEDSLRASGLPANCLELELTERLLVENVESQINLLHQLKATGIKLSIDDFGTGYSSLSYLKRFPIDTLKIDRSFINDLQTDADDAAIVNAAITLAHSLRLDVVAEGVETIAQEEILREFKCDLVQGYLHCRPKPIQDLQDWILARESIALTAAN